MDRKKPQHLNKWKELDPSWFFRVKYIIMSILFWYSLQSKDLCFTSRNGLNVITTVSRGVILCSKIACYFKNPRLNFNYPPERPAFPPSAVDMINPHIRVRPPFFSSNINSLLLSDWVTWDNREVNFSATFSLASPLSDRKASTVIRGREIEKKFQSTWDW